MKPKNSGISWFIVALSVIGIVTLIASEVFGYEGLAEPVPEVNPFVYECD